MPMAPRPPRVLMVWLAASQCEMVVERAAYDGYGGHGGTVRNGDVVVSGARHAHGGSSCCSAHAPPTLEECGQA